MNSNLSTLRPTLLGAIVGLSLAWIQPTFANAEPKTSTPPSAATMPCSPDAQKGERSDCKKVYEWVNYGPPTKDMVMRKLVRIDCPNTAK